MSSILGSLMRKAQDRPILNILTFPTHERYETGLAKTGHNFYAWRGQNIKDWNSEYAPRPDNYYLLNPQLGDNQIPPDIDFDLILSQNKFGQYPIARKLSRELHLPLVSLEHTLPPPQWSEGRIRGYKNMSAHVNVFISEYSRNKWLFEENEAQIIHHGVDTDTFKPTNLDKKIYVLSVANDFANRDWCLGFNLWKEITAGLPVTLLGKNPGLSEPAPGVDGLVNAYNSTMVFLNTSLISPIPTVLLEAMSCGCAVVSTDTCMIPDVIEHGYNGFISSSGKDLRKYLELLLEDEDLRVKLGTAARQTIVDKFHMNTFVTNWNNVFNKAKDIVYVKN